MVRGGIQLERVVLREVAMRLKSPFTTSFGTLEERIFLLVEAIDEDGVNGWGECCAFSAPWYNEETVETAFHILKDFLIPMACEKPISHPDELGERFSRIRRHAMAKAALEGAVWDIFAQKRELPLAAALGGDRPEIDVGVSIGIQPEVDDLLRAITHYLEEGYQRIKMKIKPGWDVEVIEEVRRHFPYIPLMADANSAYRLEDAEHLKQLDAYDLMMIEQPLAHDDIVDHATLQSRMETPICLDESILSVSDAKKAIALGSCKMINIKIGRVGGLSEAKKIHDYCAEQGVPVWCGGMLESGVGRAHNIALASLQNFVLPGDTSGSSRYWMRDLIDPEVTVENGRVAVPERPGIGFEVNRDVLDQYTLKSVTFQARTFQ